MRIVTSAGRLPRTLLPVVMTLAFLSQAGFSQQPGPTPKSRQEILAAQQAEKLKKAAPAKPDKIEAWVEKFEQILLVDPSGFYPYFASVYHGGGFTLGAGYRQYFGDNTFWDVKGLYSMKNYKLLEGAVESRDHLERRLSFGSRLGWRDATQVAYYGLGIKTSSDDRANFRFQETYADGHADFRPVWWIPLKGSVGYERWDTKEGQGSAPSIETVFCGVPAGCPKDEAPGLGADPKYLHTQVSAGIDWRQSPGYTRRGGLYQVTFHDYKSDQNGKYSFQKLDGDLIQHFPILRETWVLAARGRVETTLNDNDLIPYFLLPQLGSGSTLRAFASDRFRDRHSLLMTAEFRWMPSVALDLALFYDAGKVASRRKDLNFKEMKSDVGIGARFHGPRNTPLRLEFAVGNEGWQIVIAGDAIF
jgi:hypothetical protein